MTIANVRPGGQLGNPRATMRVAGRPLRALLAPLAFAYVLAALATDIAYWRTANLFWANASAWLLFAGAVFSGLTMLVVLIDLVGDSRVRAQPGAGWNALGAVAGFALVVLDNLVHSRDAWTSVVPTGLALSAAAVVVMAITGWIGLAMVYHHRVGVEG